MEDSSASQISFTIKDGNNHPVNEDDRNHTNASEDPLFHIYNVLNAASQSSGFESLGPTSMEYERTRSFKSEKVDACCRLFDEMQEKISSHQTEIPIDCTPKPVGTLMTEQSDSHLESTQLDIAERPYIMKTRMSLLRFERMVKRLTSIRKEAIDAVGFGGLLKLAVCNVFKPLIFKLVDLFDTTSHTLTIGDKKYHISADDFKMLMGVPEGGVDIVLGGEYNAVKDLRDKFCTALYDRVVIKACKMEEELLSTDEADEDFIRRFLLFAMATVLATSTASTHVIKSTYLYPLLQVAEIRTLNWASLFFKGMVDGIKRYKKAKNKHNVICITGCALFLQVYYLNKVLQEGPIEYRQLRSLGIVDIDQLENLVNMINADQWCMMVMDGEMSNGKSLQDKMEDADVRKYSGNFSRLIEAVESVNTNMKSMNEATLQYVKASIIELGNIRLSNDSMLLAIKDLVSCIKNQTIYAESGQNITSLKMCVKELVSAIQQSTKYLHFDVGAKRREFDIANDPNVEVGEAPAGNKNSNPSLELKEDPLEVMNTTSLAKDTDHELTAPRSILKSTSSSQAAIVQNAPATSTCVKTNSRSVVVGFPYDKTRSLRKEDFTKLVMFAVDESLNDEEILSKTMRRHVTRYEIRSLLPGTWIQQSILDMASEALNYEEKQIEQGMDIWFFPVFHVANSMMNVQQFVSYFTMMNIKGGFIGGQLWTCKQIYVPLFTPGHFKLLLLDTLQHKVQLMDSAQGANFLDAATISAIEILLTGMQQIYASDIQQHELLPFSSYVMDLQIGGPKQKNSIDCGVYVIQKMRSARNPANSLDSKIVTNQDEVEVLSQELRLKILVWILKHECNLLNVIVKEDAIAWFNRGRKRKNIHGMGFQSIQPQGRTKNVREWKSVPVLRRK